MPRRGDHEFLKDISTAAERILKYVKNKSFDEFIDDPILQDAVVRNLEVIGEATKNLSPSLRNKYPEIQWRAISKTRDGISHQ